jgi:pSer/pThr/pTyr-binding forkhead associated (FHA) protein
MEPIQVQLLYGPSQDQRLALQASPTLFGRDPGQGVEVPLTYASRQHGEFRFEDDAWHLVNHSPNGTFLNGRKVTTKPRQLKHEDTIAIGGQPVMRVLLESLMPLAPPKPGDGEPQGAPQAVGNEPENLSRPEETDEANAPEALADFEDEQSKNRGRLRLWIGVGVYMVAMLGLLLLFGSIETGGEASSNIPQELSRRQIQWAIRNDIEDVKPDPREAVRHLEAGQELYRRLESSKDAMYRAYRHYRLALEHAERTEFKEGLDQRRYLELEKRLVDRVTDRYSQAYTSLMAGQHRQALDGFDRLLRIYPDPDSPIIHNADRLRQIAQRNAQR